MNRTVKNERRIHAFKIRNKFKIKFRFLQIFDFQLTPKEMEQIADLDKGEEGRVVRISQHLKG